MFKNKLIKKLTLCVVVLLAVFGAQSVFAQTTAFTYQGKLNDGGNPANTGYDMQFRLFDLVGAGQGTQQGATITISPVAVSNGNFAVSLDFGAAVFASGADRFLEISLRPAGTTGGYTSLAPRQKLTSAPYSVRSINSNSADTLSTACVGCVQNSNINSIDGSKVTGSVAQADNAANAVIAGNALNLGGVPASGYLPKTGGTISGSLTVNGVLSGDGSGLTNLPGSGFVWQEVTGTTQQALSNRGYIANDTGQVTITLPDKPNVGDVVRVSGAGTGGWKIAQNAGQFIHGSNLGFWTPRENPRDWKSVASSADGTKLVAVVLNGQIYTSDDSGISWLARESNRGWYSVASSADGTKLVAVVLSGQIYTSDDSGASWTPRETNRNWSSVASSADGTKLVAVVSGTRIYTSSDSGATWTPRETIRTWGSVASSADGTKLVAFVQGGLIYTSVDSGVTWTPRATNRTWQSVASSADGTKLVASVFNGQIYTSSNSGASWTPRESIRNWSPVASSADGTKLVAVVQSGQIYISVDSGATWTARESNRGWQSVASSADGTKLVAVPTGEQIYTMSLDTTIGVDGYLSGGTSTAVELQYVGGGKFIWLSHEGDIFAF